MSENDKHLKNQLEQAYHRDACFCEVLPRAAEALAHKDARITDYMNICEDLSRKLEEARGRIAGLTIEADRHVEEITNLRNVQDDEMESLAVDLDKARHTISTLREACKFKNDKIEEQDARIAKLEAAIKPFAEGARELREIETDEMSLWGTTACSKVTAGDVRRAAAAYVRTVEPPEETIAWAEGVFAAEDERDARIAELERDLTKFHEAQPLRGREMWAVWNSCDGVFEVARWRHVALDIIAEAYSEHETAVPVRVFVEPEDDHGLRHSHEDEREVQWRERTEKEQGE